MTPLPRRAVGRERRRGPALVLGAAVIAAACALFWVGIRAADEIPGRSYYEIEAEFADAEHLAPHFQVRIGGRLVGQVLGPRVEGTRAVVRLQLDESVRPLRSDTRLRVRPRSPIGVRYVDLEPGTRGRPLGDGERIRAANTSAAVQIDESLRPFDGPTRRMLARTLDALGEGAAGRGADTAEVLEELPGALTSLRSLTEAVIARRGAAGRLVRSAAGAAGAADPVREAIADSAERGERALRPLAERGGDVGAALREAPHTLGAARASLPPAAELVRELGGLARDATPLLADARPALGEAAGLTREARRPLARARTTLARLRSAAPRLEGLLDAAAPALPNADRALSEGIPLLRELRPRDCDWHLAFGNFADAMSFGTERNNMLRILIDGGGPDSVAGEPGGSPAERPRRSNAYPEPCQAPLDGVAP